MDISVVIPIYGCKGALPELYSRLTKSLTKITNDYEIIFVNDACPQNSWQVIEKICQEDKKVVGIELSRNFGQIRAITAGLDNSKGDLVVVMDCDLQDRPEEIINLYNKLLEGYDVVVARRKERQDSKLKIFVSQCFYKVYSYAIDSKYDGALCNFSISKRKVIESYCSMRENHRAYIMYLQWLGFKHAVIDVEHNERYEGKSGYNFRKRINMAVEFLTSQSDKILKLTVKFGFLVSLLSFLWIIVLLVRYFASDMQVGWTSIIASVFFMGGIMISCIGIVGIYVGNIFMEVKNRPLYVIRKILNKSEDE